MGSKIEQNIGRREGSPSNGVKPNAKDKGDAIRLLTILIISLSQNQKPLRAKRRTDKGKAIIQSLIKTSENKISNLQSDLGKRKSIKESLRNKERALRKWEKEINERYFYVKNREHVIDVLNKKLELLENRLKEKEGEIAELEEGLKQRQEEIEVNKKILYELQKIILEKQHQIDEMKNNYMGFEEDKDTKRILWVLDELLGSLPKDLIEKFAQSEDFRLYEEVLRKYNV